MAELPLEQKGTVRTPARGVMGMHYMQMGVCVQSSAGQDGTVSVTH